MTSSPDTEYYAPHCDSSVLHAPGACQYCDMYPNWQQYRERARINYTGQHDPERAPCPSTHFRDDQTRDRWAGNRAYPASSEPPSMLTWTSTPRPPAPPGAPAQRRLGEWWRDRIERILEWVYTDDDDPPC